MKYERIIPLFVFLVLFISLFASIPLTSASDSDDISENKVTIYFFWGVNCPYCDIQKPYLEEWQEKYSDKIKVLEFETWNNRDNHAIFQQVASVHGTTARGVPTTFIGERHWVGFSSSMAPEMESYIQQCIEEGCEDLADDLNLQGDDEHQEQEESTDTSQPELCINVFLDGSCPQCQSILPYLESLDEKYGINIERYDIFFEENKTLFKEFKENYGLKAELYPTVFIGEKYLMGEEPIRTAIEQEIENCLESGCPCPLSKVKPYTPITPRPEDVTPGEKQVIDFLGMEIDVGTMPLFFSTFLISFVDGFNPCSLFVLMFLLGIVIYTGSRKKIFAIGFTYLAVAAIVYGLFILMVFNVFLYVGYLAWIKVLVASVAFIFAIVNIKDFFWYKKGISFTIPDSYKPKIFKKVRNLMKHDGNIWGLILGSALLALGITLVELPCTAGLPWIWSSIMAQYELSFMNYALLFLTYILVYFSVELVIFLTAVFTLNISKFEESHGRTLKLIGGLIMAMLGFVLLYDHTLMEDIGTTMILFLGTIGLGLLIAWIYKKKVGFKPGAKKLENNEDSSKKEKNETSNEEGEDKNKNEDNNEKTSEGEKSLNKTPNKEDKETSNQEQNE